MAANPIEPTVRNRYISLPGKTNPFDQYVNEGWGGRWDRDLSRRVTATAIRMKNMRTIAATNKKSGRPATFTVVRSGIPLTVTTTWPCAEANRFFEAWTVTTSVELWRGEV